ncbi:hypothetical protein D3C76_1247310 [compost metagenome]
MTRPIMSNVGPFAKTKQSEPRILNISPRFVIFFRPILSARPPAATIKIPEKRAVKLIAMFNVPEEIPKSS